MRCGPRVAARCAAGLLATLIGSLPLMAEQPRDPFLFGQRTPSSVGPTTPALTGILWDEHSPLALLDGEPITVGRTVSGWRLVAIHPDRVVIERHGQQVSLAPGDHIPAE